MSPSWLRFPFLFAATMAAAWISNADAAAPAQLTTLHSIHSLTKEQAQSGLPVAFEATVTYYSPSNVDLFVQEAGEAIYVETKPNEALTPGDRVIVTGITRASFTTDVLSESVKGLSHGTLPKPISADFGQLIRAERDCLRVSVRATVRSADAVSFGDMQGVY